MEHPPKQGLKRVYISTPKKNEPVLMEHPPKQGLKLVKFTDMFHKKWVLMEHPPKQGLKQLPAKRPRPVSVGFNGTSTKTRIET